MRVEYTRIGPAGVVGVIEKDFDGGLNTDPNPLRILDDLYGSDRADPLTPGASYNPVDPLQQCRHLSRCHWTAITRIDLNDRSNTETEQS